LLWYHEGRICFYAQNGFGFCLKEIAGFSKEDDGVAENEHWFEYKSLLCGE